MSSATVTSKGQITIPKELREDLGLEPGDTVHFVLREDGEVVMEPEGRNIRELQGCIEPDVGGVSVEAMKDVVRNRGGEQ
ncbi:MAG: AbrB/MazE/SpoVT family DNA-binding domain-containing protein [Bradymonadaceae bacterium]